MSVTVRAPFCAYENYQAEESEREPYAFVSYAHEDKEVVYNDIKFLWGNGKGYRLWYDQGLRGADGIDAAIQTGVLNSHFVIAFISPASIQSEYCRGEILTALDEGKQVLPVFLCETELKHGLRIRLGHVLRVLRFKYLPDRLPEYYEELTRALPEMIRFPPEPSEASEVQEFKILIESCKANVTDPATDAVTDLLDTAELMGIDKAVAQRIIAETIDQDNLKMLGQLRRLAEKFLSRGPLTDINWKILANRAKEWGLAPLHWERVVQEEAIKRAKELYDGLDVDKAVDTLVSSVGEHVEQLADARKLIEKLHREREKSAESAGQKPVLAAALPVQVRFKDEGPPPSTGAAAPRAKTQLIGDVMLDWAHVPSGLFVRGCPDEFIRHIEAEYEGINAHVFKTFPVRKEPLDEYWISLTPVTNAQFYTFVKATGHRFPAGWRGTTPPFPANQELHPVTGVSWQDAVDFASWIGARLPTRAEFEKACRGENGLLYPWGNRFDKSYCNTGESDPEATTPVGAFPKGASAYGVLDLVGNVWEWAADGRDGRKMTVGASFKATAEIYGVGFFDVSRPAEMSENDLGFRVACDDVSKLSAKAVSYEVTNDVR